MAALMPQHEALNELKHLPFKVTDPDWMERLEEQEGGYP